MKKYISMWFRSMAGLLVMGLCLFVMGCDDGGGGDDNDDSKPDTSSPDSGPKVYMAAGDGITSGSGPDVGGPWPGRLANMLGTPIINAAVAHSHVTDGVNHINNALSEHDPDYVLILYGSNDVGLENSSDFIANSLRTIVQAVKAHGAIAIVATLPPISGQTADIIDRLNRVNKKIRQMADEEGVACADVASEFDNDTSLLIDGLHPTSEGQDIIAMTFYEKL